MSNRGIAVRWIWFFITLCLLAYGLFLALRGSPPDAAQGNMIRAFYYHFPNWIGVGVFLPINFIASIAFLFLRSSHSEAAMKCDAAALASAEMGVLFCTLGMISGSLWAREEWGIYWTWDARLTTTLILWLIYIAYLLVRHISYSSSRATICAALAVFGFADAPIVYMSTQWFRTQHPAPVFGGGPNSGIASSMSAAAWWNVAAWVAWGLLIASIRYASELRHQQNELSQAMNFLDTVESAGVNHV